MSTQANIDKLYFEDGLPGFPQLQFFSLTQQEPDSPFYILQSLENEQVSFYAVDPFPFFKEYEFILPQQTKASLHIQEETPVAVINIVTLRQDGWVTCNLKAPIVINKANRMARQVILNDESYNVRQPLFQVPQKAANE